MTHEELLAKIDAWEYSDYKAMGTTSEWPYKIIRAVVELHKPWETLPQLENPLVWCEVCQEDYPCPTIQAIDKELE